MGLNIAGFATSIKTNNLSEIASMLDIKISECIGTCMFEESISNSIEDDDIIITETAKGSIINVGLNFPIFEIFLQPLSKEGNRLLRFVIGETSMIFLFEYHENGKALRRRVVQDYDTVHEEGKTLDIEFSGEEIDEIISQLIEQVCGESIYTIEPNQLSVRYKFMGLIEKTESMLETNNQKHKKKTKPWWKFW